MRKSKRPASAEPLIVCGNPQPASDACSVYRFFDKDEALLYVGVSDKPLLRMKKHRMFARWFPLATKCNIEWMPSREIALVEETKAIATEKPLHNGYPGRPPLPPAEKRKYIQLTLPTETIERARKIGAGNVSAGVEKSVAETPLP